MSDDLLVTTRHGVIEGVGLRDGVSRFFNVPYARPPWGDLRFARPQPPEPWRGVRDGTRPGSTPPQWEVTMPLHRRLASPGWIPGDDILTVNVWTPDVHGRAPVAVYIHGGAFMEGNGILPFYDGASFARDGIVLVTLNYRVGMEGFLWLDGGEPNLGLLDQVAALEWVRDSIADFGGDPERVTIFGQSAGGASVTALGEMPAARGLFRAAINQSGPTRLGASPETARHTAQVVAAHLGLAPTADAFREVPPAVLVDAISALTGGGGDPLNGRISLTPVRDEVHLPPLAERELAPVPWIVGVTSDEWAFFTWDSDAQPTDADLIASAAKLSSEPARLVAELRAAFPEWSAADLQRQMLNHTLFVSAAFEQLTDRARVTDDVWLYVFDEASKAHGGRPGPHHSLDLAFVFDVLDSADAPALTGDDPSRKVAADIHGAWVSFFRGHDPGWSRYDADAERYRRFAHDGGEESRPFATWRRIVDAHPPARG